MGCGASSSDPSHNRYSKRRSDDPMDDEFRSVTPSLSASMGTFATRSPTMTPSVQSTTPHNSVPGPTQWDLESPAPIGEPQGENFISFIHSPGVGGSNELSKNRPAVLSTSSIATGGTHASMQVLTPNSMTGKSFNASTTTTRWLSPDRSDIEGRTPPGSSTPLSPTIVTPSDSSPADVLSPLKSPDVGPSFDRAVQALNPGQPQTPPATVSPNHTAAILAVSGIADREAEPQTKYPAAMVRSFCPAQCRGNPMTTPPTTSDWFNPPTRAADDRNDRGANNLGDTPVPIELTEPNSDGGSVKSEPGRAAAAIGKVFRSFRARAALAIDSVDDAPESPYAVVALRSLEECPDALKKELMYASHGCPTKTVNRVLKWQSRTIAPTPKRKSKRRDQKDDGSDTSLPAETKRLGVLRHRPSRTPSRSPASGSQGFGGGTPSSTGLTGGTSTHSGLSIDKGTSSKSRKGILVLEDA